MLIAGIVSPSGIRSTDLMLEGIYLKLMLTNDLSHHGWIFKTVKSSKHLQGFSDFSMFILSACFYTTPLSKLKAFREKIAISKLADYFLNPLNVKIYFVLLLCFIYRQIERVPYFLQPNFSFMDNLLLFQPQLWPHLTI